MIFGKHINRYYLKYAPLLLLGLLALALVDFLQLEIPELYQMVINGMNQGYVMVDGVQHAFDMAFLLDKICMPMVVVVVSIVFGRFLWRVCIFGAAIRVETNLRDKMFDHAKLLSREYYQQNKVGNLMSLFTNDLDTVQECYGWGFMQFFDALILGTLSIVKMWQMDHLLTALSLIPMALLFASASIVGRVMTKKWDYRQECFSNMSDFAQESFSGIAVIKAFVKETKELLAFEKLNKESEVSNIDYTKVTVLLRILVTTFVESVICVILGYGGGFSNLPTLLSDVYGMGNISSLHGIALSAWAIAGLTGNQIADLIVSKTGNFQNILIFTAIMYAIALVVDILFVHPKRTPSVEKLED